MNATEKNRFSGPVTVFQERRIPERATPAGYAALTDDEAARIETIYHEVFADAAPVPDPGGFRSIEG